MLCFWGTQIKPVRSFLYEFKDGLQLYLFNKYLLRPTMFQAPLKILLEKQNEENRQRISVIKLIL